MTDTRRIVTDMYAAYERHDFDRVTNYIHDDVDWIIYGPMQIFPFVGQRKGKVAVLTVLGDIAKEYSLESYRPEVIIADGDRAAVMSDVSFRQRSTSRTLRMKLVNLLRLQDGKVIEFREFSNTFDLVEQALGREFDV